MEMAGARSLSRGIRALLVGLGGGAGAAFGAAGSGADSGAAFGNGFGGGVGQVGLGRIGIDSLALKLVQFMAHTRIADAHLRWQARKSASPWPSRPPTVWVGKSSGDKSRAYAMALTECCEACAAIERSPAPWGACAPAHVEAVVSLAVRSRPPLPTSAEPGCPAPSNPHPLPNPPSFLNPPQPPDITGPPF
jgi:hypothetical protein